MEGACALCLARAPLDVSRAPNHHSRRDATSIAHPLSSRERSTRLRRAPNLLIARPDRTTRLGAVKISTRLESHDETWGLVCTAVRLYFPHAQLPTSLSRRRLLLRMTFGEQYPKPPRVRFTSEVFHPNVYSDGTLCMDIIQDQWSYILACAPS